MVNIKDHGPELSESDISDLEKRLSAMLPKDYRRFLLEFNGGRPVPDIVDIDGLPGSEADVQAFFGIDDPVESYNIDWNLKTLAGRLEAGLLPIGCDSGGNVFCISLRKRDRGAVLYCDLQSVFADLEAKPDVYPVASDFETFLSGLRPFS
jgi:hypothetical protein